MIFGSLGLALASASVEAPAESFSKAAAARLTARLWRGSEPLEGCSRRHCHGSNPGAQNKDTRATKLSKSCSPGAGKLPPALASSEIAP